MGAVSSPAQGPAQVPVQAPTPASVTPVPVTPIPTAAPQTPAVAVPTAAAPAYTIDQIAKAGGDMMTLPGAPQKLGELLAKYGLATVTDLKPEQYGAFATDLRALGARI